MEPGHFSKKTVHFPAPQDAAELFASLTQFRRVRLGAGRLRGLAQLFAGPPQDLVKPSHEKLTPRQLAEAQRKLKARARRILGDTSAFPREPRAAGPQGRVV